jgi:hypothetical protein
MRELVFGSIRYHFYPAGYPFFLVRYVDVIKVRVNYGKAGQGCAVISPVAYTY